MAFHSYTLTAAQREDAINALSLLCSLDTDAPILNLNLNRAMSLFNAEVCLNGQLDEDTAIDNDTLTAVIVPIAAGYTQQWQHITTPHVSSMSEGDGSVTFTQATYSTDIADYKPYMRRYRRLKTL